MKTLLVVDDHPVTRRGIAKALKTMPDVAHVLEASEGARAVELVREAQPDLVLLDLNLPPEEGITLITQIKTAHAACRVLVVSGRETRRYGNRAMRAGAEGFVSKTAQLKTLLDAVEMVMAGFCVFPDEIYEKAFPAARQQISTLQDLARQAPLTDRERLVMSLLVKGLSNQAIAAQLGLGARTVSVCKVALMKKLGVAHVIELADLAVRLHDCA